MPEKEILLYQNAISELYATQNSSLCDEAIQSTFVFTTGTVSFESAVSASCEIDSASLLQDPKKDKGKTLSQLLTQYFLQLCGNETIMLQARASYSNQAYKNLDPDIYPVFLQTKHPLSKENAAYTANAWAGKIKDWRSDFSSYAFTEKESIFFELVFFTDTTQVPLLTVKKLSLDGEYFTLIGKQFMAWCRVFSCPRPNYNDLCILSGDFLFNI